MSVLTNKNFFQQSKKLSGFTLIELLLYIALLAIILSASSFYLRSVLQTRARNQTVAEVDQQGYFAMQKILQQVRNATSVIAPKKGISAKSLALVVPPDMGQSPTIFLVQDGILKMKQGSALAINLTSAKVKVLDFNVRNVSVDGAPDSIRVELTVARDAISTRWEFNYSKYFEGGGSLRK